MEEEEHAEARSLVDRHRGRRRCSPPARPRHRLPLPDRGRPARRQGRLRPRPVDARCGRARAPRLAGHPPRVRDRSAAGPELRAGRARGVRPRAGRGRPRVDRRRSERRGRDRGPGCERRRRRAGHRPAGPQPLGSGGRRRAPGVGPDRGAARHDADTLAGRLRRSSACVLAEDPPPIRCTGCCPRPCPARRHGRRSLRRGGSGGRGGMRRRDLGRGPNAGAEAVRALQRLDVAFIGGDRLLDPDFLSTAGSAAEGAFALCACANVSTSPSSPPGDSSRTTSPSTASRPGPSPSRAGTPPT